MNNIIGIGLPRTGTASLSRALMLLGKRSRHYCILNDNPRTPSVKCNSVYVDNSFYRIYKSVLFDNEFQNSLFILTTRNLINWERSMSKFKLVDNMPNVSNYEKDIKKVFKKAGKENQLLIIDIFEDPISFKRVADFIGVEHSNITFPHINKEKSDTNDVKCFHWLELQQTRHFIN